MKKTNVRNISNDEAYKYGMIGIEHIIHVPMSTTAETHARARKLD